MKSKELRTILSRLFSDNQLHAYFGDNTGEFGLNNYKINYQLPNNTLTEQEAVYRLEVDIWCNDSIEVDELADTIEQIFDYATHVDINLGKFILETRYDASEKDIYRRTLVYEVRTY